MGVKSGQRYYVAVCSRLGSKHVKAQRSHPHSLIVMSFKGCILRAVRRCTEASGMAANILRSGSFLHPCWELNLGPLRPNCWGPIVWPKLLGLNYWGLIVGGLLSEAVLFKTPTSLSSVCCRWAVKQERLDNLGQWKHTDVENPEWNKQALSWPVRRDGSLNDDYDWPMEGYLLPYAPPIKLNVTSADSVKDCSESFKIFYLIYLIYKGFLIRS